MRAVQLKQFTQHVDDVTVSEVPEPAPGNGEVLVHVEAAAINPSDLLNIRGGFPTTTLPRIIGRDFAGRVVQGPVHLRGRDVWGAGGGDLGFTRDGTHAEYIVLPEDGVALRPRELPAVYAAACGLPYITAWLALVKRAQIKRDEVVVVSGAAGAVGTAAIELVYYAGANAIGLIKDATERDLVHAAKVKAIAQSDKGDLEAVVRDATAGKGCEAALNAVGAAVFDPLFASLANRGRMSIVAAAAGRTLEHFDLLDLYRRDLSLHGINTADPAFTVVQTSRILTELVPGFEAGQIAPITPTDIMPLEHAPQAYARAASGANQKIVLVP